MPVNYDNFFRTVRFSYTNERDSGFSLDFEFHYTDEFGPTLTIHNMDGGPLSLPFSAYSDAVDAIRAEGGAGTPIVPRPSPQSSARGSAVSPPRLMPTRVANSKPQSSPRQQVIQPKQPPEFQPQPQVEEMPPPFGGGTPYAGGIYDEQHSILTSDSVVESLHNTQQPIRKVPRPRTPREDVVNEEESFSGDDESLPPEMSLRNGLAKRKGVEQGVGVKRIRKLDPIPDNGQR